VVSIVSRLASSGWSRGVHRFAPRFVGLVTWCPSFPLRTGHFALASPCLPPKWGLPRTTYTVLGRRVTAAWPGSMGYYGGATGPSLLYGLCYNTLYIVYLLLTLLIYFNYNSFYIFCNPNPLQ